jgi:hypothetical protein
MSRASREPRFASFEASPETPASSQTGPIRSDRPVMGLILHLRSSADRPMACRSELVTTRQFSPRQVTSPTVCWSFGWIFC